MSTSIITPTPITLPSFSVSRRDISAILHTELMAEPTAHARLTSVARGSVRGDRSVAKSAPAGAAIALGGPLSWFAGCVGARRHFTSEGHCISQGLYRAQGFFRRMSVGRRRHCDFTAATSSIALWAHSEAPPAPPERRPSGSVRGGPRSSNRVDTPAFLHTRLRVLMMTNGQTPSNRARLCQARRM